MIRCGKGHEHATVADVRECYGVGAGSDTLRLNRPSTFDDRAIPAGYYAVPSKTGNNDLDFYRVDKPEEGKWKGYTFVKAIIGGHAPIAIRGAKSKEVLSRIEVAGIDAARELYGRTLGMCGVCGRTLTDEESRARGIGPVCLEKMGNR